MRCPRKGLTYLKDADMVIEITGCASHSKIKKLIISDDVLLDKVNKSCITCKYSKISNYSDAVCALDCEKSCVICYIKKVDINRYNCKSYEVSEKT